MQVIQGGNSPPYPRNSTAFVNTSLYEVVVRGSLLVRTVLHAANQLGVTLGVPVRAEVVFGTCSIDIPEATDRPVNKDTISNAEPEASPKCRATMAESAVGSNRGSKREKALKGDGFDPLKGRGRCSCYRLPESEQHTVYCLSDWTLAVACIYRNRRIRVSGDVSRQFEYLAVPFLAAPTPSSAGGAQAQAPATLQELVDDFKNLEKTACQ
ncbi:hypothetical protein BJ912DRAFT_930065 [Pholiota molesta]|nr:hypothetical protein BJ912DRAFT_930065 [Pholiota molesta]